MRIWPEAKMKLNLQLELFWWCLFNNILFNINEKWLVTVTIHIYQIFTIVIIYNI